MSKVISRRSAAPGRAVAVLLACGLMGAAVAQAGAAGNAPASFLLARDGFMVSAASRGGEVRFVEIESRRGEECRLRNPWGEAAVALTRDGRPASELSGSLLRFQTKKGEVVALAPRGRR